MVSMQEWTRLILSIDEDRGTKCETSQSCINIDDGTVRLWIMWTVLKSYDLMTHPSFGSNRPAGACMDEEKWCIPGKHQLFEQWTYNKTI